MWTDRAGCIVDESRFWSMIEDAWHAAGGKDLARLRLAQGKLCEDRAEALVEALEDFIPALQAALGKLTAADLLAFDRSLERKLYQIDRAEVQAATDGSDDGFLYARGFIIAAGRAYFEAVDRTPSIAMMDLECEEICFLPQKAYEKKFGPMPASGISRESGSNPAGWPGLSRGR